jgi:site-specific recombinase XerC
MVTIQTTECIEGFQQWLSEPQYSNPQNTIRAYSSDIRMFFFEWRVESFRPEDLNNLAAGWLKWRASIRSLAKYIEMEGPVLQHFKTPTIGQRIPHPLPHLEEDLVRLIEVARDDAERALVGCLGYEGMRMHEALAQPLGKIDFAGGAINVIGKGDKERRIPITKNGSSYIMPQYIKAMCMSQPTLLSYGDRTARNIITSMGERADIRNRDGSPRAISSHDLRATFATVVYRDTKDIRLVQVLLGHADVSTTQIYIELSFEQMREAVG